MRFAVIDIECTGGSWGDERIIDVAVFILENGDIVDQFISLVNPKRGIDPYVTKLTGISNKMVRTAPKFYEIAKRLVKITEDTTFVAHNIGFDYRVFQQEFEALGFDYHRATLDTIPYCERMFPNWSNYGLKTVAKELGLINSARHRAEGDARLTMELLKILLEKDRSSFLEEVQVSKSDSENRNPFKEQVKHLHNKVGMYYIYNDSGEPIYIGNSKDLQNSINRHFVADNKLALSLQAEAKSIEIEDFGNEAIAQIQHKRTLDKLRPLYNSTKKKQFLGFGIFTEPKKSVLVDFVRVHPIRNKQPEFYFEGDKSMYGFLQHLMMNESLDPLSFLLDKDREHYFKNTKKLQWKAKSKQVTLSTMRQYLFPSDATLIGPGRKGNEKCAILIENSRLIGYTYFYLATDGTNRPKLKKRMVHLEHDAYAAGIIHHFYQKGYLEELETE
jgi:DNA polymerase III subunit epsilon